MDYTIIRSRRKTISVEITPRGDILVRCPNRMKKADIETFLKSKEVWIKAHLPQEQVKVLSDAEVSLLRQQAKEDLSRRVSHFASLVGVDFDRITIRSQKTRWGSCTAKGNLNFNCLLMLAPPEIRNYVVVHELCHRKEMNHSPAFWAEVEAVLPDYRVRRKWLKENGTALIAKLP